MSDERHELPTVERAERCETCRYSEPVEGEDLANEHNRYCKRHPPVLLPNKTRDHALDCLQSHLDEADEDPHELDVTAEAGELEGDSCVVWGFPVVTSEDWCGEWKAKVSTDEKILPPVDLESLDARWRMAKERHRLARQEYRINPTAENKETANQRADQCRALMRARMATKKRNKQQSG